MLEIMSAVVMLIVLYLLLKLTYWIYRKIFFAGVKYAVGKIMELAEQEYLPTETDTWSVDYIDFRKKGLVAPERDELWDEILHGRTVHALNSLLWSVFHQGEIAGYEAATRHKREI